MLFIVLLATILVAARASIVTSGDCGDNVTWTYDPAFFTLRIAGSGPMKDFSGGDPHPWHVFNSFIQHFVIEEGVTTIGNYACNQCRALSSISIPTTVKTIGSLAFKDCVSLEGVSIPSSVTSIGGQCFRGCTSLKTIDIPSSVITIEGSVFLGCVNLTSVTIPGSVSSIATSTFSGCIKLNNVTIQNGVESINMNAFNGCVELKSIFIPASVSTIGYDSFYGCNHLETIKVDKENSQFKSNEDGVVFSKNGTILVLYPPGKNGDYVIPSTVTSIEQYAFHGCNGLTSITIPEGITTIGRLAFSECNSLTNVTIPSSVTSISASAGSFSSCSNLESIIVNPSNKNFNSTDGILYTKNMSILLQYPAGKKGDTFEIPYGVTKLGRSSFHGCYRLTNISIPDSVTTINSNAFTGTSLKIVTIPSSVTTIFGGPFASCVNLTSIEVDSKNKNFTSIDGVLFNKNITKLIQFPAGKNCDHYSIPDTVFTIDTYSFEMSNITNITIPDNVKNIETNAFLGCNNLESVTYQGMSNPNISGNVFNQCYSLKFICVPLSYSGTSFCEKTNIAFSAHCEELKDDSNECYEVIPINKEWISQQKHEVEQWESQTDECVQYFCDNDTGMVAKSRCDKNSGPMCMDGKCIQNDTLYEGDGYVVIIELKPSSDVYLNSNTAKDFICEISGLIKEECDGIVFAVEYEDDGTILRMTVHVERESTADVIAESVKNCSESNHQMHRKTPMG